MEPRARFRISDLRIEHHRAQYLVGIGESRPRISWNIVGEPGKCYQQDAFDVELYEQGSRGCLGRMLQAKHVACGNNILVQWPFDAPLRSRDCVAIKVRLWVRGEASPWSSVVAFEIGLLERGDWLCQRIAAKAHVSARTADVQPEALLRKEFSLRSGAKIARARLYVAVQGVVVAEMNGQRVSDDFLSPGWTVYDKRIRYQTYDVTDLLADSTGMPQCIAFRIAEGWSSGRLGFFGGKRQRWSSYPAVMGQLMVTYADDEVDPDVIITDDSWCSSFGPVMRGELYDGEKYDARTEEENWSKACEKPLGRNWERAIVLDPLPTDVDLFSGSAEPMRPVETIKPAKVWTTARGKIVIDFGQNLVGYVRFKNVKARHGHKMFLYFAEVLEQGEICRRALRLCESLDEYTFRGLPEGESWSPHFTFHGFRYCQIDHWPESADLTQALEAVICHTDMEVAGHFSCSDPMLTRLYQNAVWSMRGNFLSIPTDCPQRDERLGWTGDIALFAPTAVKMYKVLGLLKDWLVDVGHDQKRRDGVPPFVCPDILDDPLWGRIFPVAIWHDVVILVPWELYQASGDTAILLQFYQNMKEWIDVIPRQGQGSSSSHLWDNTALQLGVSFSSSVVLIKADFD